MELTDPVLPAPWQLMLQFPPFGSAVQELPGDQPLADEIRLPVTVNGSTAWMHFVLDAVDGSSHTAEYTFTEILTWG